MKNTDITPIKKVVERSKGMGAGAVIGACATLGAVSLFGNSPVTKETESVAKSSDREVPSLVQAELPSLPAEVVLSKAEAAVTWEQKQPEFHKPQNVTQDALSYAQFFSGQRRDRSTQRAETFQGELSGEQARVNALNSNFQAQILALSNSSAATNLLSIMEGLGKGSQTSVSNTVTASHQTVTELQKAILNMLEEVIKTTAQTPEERIKAMETGGKAAAAASGGG